ncbi:hypothetical protein D3C74_26810 [compost metagenome]
MVYIYVSCCMCVSQLYVMSYRVCVCLPLYVLSCFIVRQKVSRMRILSSELEAGSAVAWKVPFPSGCMRLLPGITLICLAHVIGWLHAKLVK